MRRRLSLAGQLLVLQLALVLLVLVAVALVSLAQSRAQFDHDEGRRVRAVAETVAGNAALRQGLDVAGDADVVRTLAESARSVSGVDEVLVLRPDRKVLASSDPDLLGTRAALGSGGQVLSGRGWTGNGRYEGRSTVSALVPVLGDNRHLVGVVGASTLRPHWFEVLREDSPQLLVYLGLASLLGGAGSLLLARRVKRQTLGLEPRAIAALAEHRDAMLQGVREGVVAVDDDQRLTLANDEARTLLGLPPDAVGRSLSELGLPDRVVALLTGADAGSDRVVVHEGRMLVLNQRAIASRGRSLGSVTTMRDRTEMVTLQSELDATRVATGTLRAQAHEFDNRLHVIAGLVELGEYDEVAHYVHGVRGDRARQDQEVSSRVRDPALAALLVAKTSLAAEQLVDLQLDPASDLEHVDDELTSDLVTILGNLVDNALDAAADSVERRVSVLLAQSEGQVRVEVTDSGAGVPLESRARVFEEGWSTKEGVRGFGLALTRLACTRRGGDVVLADGAPSRVTAVVPSSRSEVVWR